VVKLVAIIGVPVVIVASAIFVVVSTVVSVVSVKASGDDLVWRTAGQTKQISPALGPLGGLPTTGSAADLKAARQRTDDATQRAAQARALVERDRADLDSAVGQLDREARNPLARPLRSGLMSERARLTSVMTALDAADSGIQIREDELRMLSALLDAMADLATMQADVEGRDFAGGLAVFPSLGRKLDAAKGLAAGPHNGSQVRQLVDNLQQTVNDLLGILDAARRNDRSGVNALLPRLDGDRKALQAFDQGSR